MDEVVCSGMATRLSDRKAALVPCRSMTVRHRRRDRGRRSPPPRHPARRSSVREYSTALQVQVSTTGNLTDDVVRNGTEVPDWVAFSRRTADGWSDVSARQFLGEVRAVAKGLVAAGV